MARYCDKDVAAILDMAARWKDDCLIDGGSLLWPGSQVWTAENLAALKKCVVDDEDTSTGTSFLDKLQQQLNGQSPDVTKAACEVLLVYYLFPGSVNRETKASTIRKVASWAGLEIDPAQTFSFFNDGVGHPGVAYLARQWNEYAYILIASHSIAEKSREERSQILSVPAKFVDILQAVPTKFGPQSRHALLYIVFPDRYERIVSGEHKRQIAQTFAGVLDPPVPEDTDAALYAIRTKLASLLGTDRVDFYLSPLGECWRGTNSLEDVGDPLDGLKLRKQIVLYGPPGTGKTWTARDLATRVVRQGLFTASTWGIAEYFKRQEEAMALIGSRITRVQFHPGYCYEDFIRGLQIVDGGHTAYRPGALLQIIGEANKHPDIPYVAILDELNRTDLSKTMGEAFSAIEDRGLPIKLAGQDAADITVPDNIYFIGTMNMIDQSLEHVDFALRRRFLWFPMRFDGDSFISVSQRRWTQKIRARAWSRHEAEFDVLLERAKALNAHVAAAPLLGEQYEIGHTYFCDVVDLVALWLDRQENPQTVLFDRAKRNAKWPVAALWKFSIGPLLDQYLAGAESGERKKLLNRLENIVLKGTSSSEP